MSATKPRMSLCSSFKGRIKRQRAEMRGRRKDDERSARIIMAAGSRKEKDHEESAVDSRIISATIPVPPIARPTSEVALRSLLSYSHLSFGIADSSLE